MKHTPTVPPQARNNPAGKAPLKHARPARGNMKPNEIKPLVMAARKAYEIQLTAGLIDDGDTFDTWRHRECMTAVRRPGITSCNHEDFRPLLSHFQHLAGDDGAAFASSMKGGKPSDHAPPGDTHENRRHLAHLISEVLAAHTHLATTSVDKLLEESKEVFAVLQPGQAWELGTGPDTFQKLLDRKSAIGVKGKGPITVGYVVYLVRQKTRRPDLVLGNDWVAGLAERCTASQLRQIHYTVVNRINALEGLGSCQDRNQSQRSPKAKADRDKNQIAPRW